MEAAERAEAAGAWPLAAESQERLSDDLHGLGFLRLALHWTEKALGSVEQLLASAQDPKRRDHLTRRALRLGERVVEIELALASEFRRILPRSAGDASASGCPG